MMRLRYEIFLEYPAKNFFVYFASIIKPTCSNRMFKEIYFNLRYLKSIHGINI